MGNLLSRFLNSRKDDGTKPPFLAPFADWQGGRFFYVRRSGKADGSGIPGTSHSVILAFHSPTPLFDARPDQTQVRTLTKALTRFAQCRWTEAGVDAASTVFPNSPRPSFLQIMLQTDATIEDGSPAQIFEIHFGLADNRVVNQVTRGGLLIGDSQARFIL